MISLTEEHINYIINDIHFRGVVHEELGEELVDHICALVEEKMSEGSRFIEAYDSVIKEFGQEKHLQQLQRQTIEYSNNNTKIMVKNYFKIALRNLVKHKFYSTINIMGLSVGVACSLIIFLFISHELSFDRFHDSSDRIYRVVRHGMFSGNEFHIPVAPAPFANAIAQEIPEVETAVRFRGQGNFLVKTPEAVESYKETDLIFTDSTFFELFSFEVLEGDGEKALNAPNTIAISKSAADKYFPNGSALNKTLILDGNQNYTVTAVFADMPKNSHLQFDFLMSLATIGAEANNNMWLSNNFFSYFRLREDADPKVAEEKIMALTIKYMAPQIEEYIGKTIEEFAAAGSYMNVELQPLTEVYLTSDFTFDIGRMGNRSYTLLFGAIAIFIIGLACINFMNLSTARSANRAKEVGVRKVLGSVRSHLIRQFMIESVLMSLIACMVGVFLVSLVLPYFNYLASRNLHIPFESSWFILSLIGGALLIGIIAGLYPAFFLSSFLPINTLKGKLALGSGSSVIRSGLVVFQFFISILLIIGTIAINNQLRYIQNKKIGFDKSQVVLINDAYMLGDQREAFKKEIDNLSTVASSSYSGFIPINGYNRNDNTYWKQGEAPTEDNMVSMQMWAVDQDYIKTMGMEIIEGRDFNKLLASDSLAIIMNETAYRKFGFDDLQESIQTFAFDPQSGSSSPDKFDQYSVIGVVKDFHFESMKQNIGPLAMRLGRNSGIISVKLSTEDFANSLDLIEEKWQKFGSGLPFNYDFLDEEFGAMYRSETRLGQIFAIFAGLAIFIGCLGLFALASFMAEQRTKEIGIRKVLGASVNTIVFMLSKEFSKLVIIAFVLAVPAAWWGISSWLSNYNYRISLGMELFLISGVLAFVIAWLTVGYQSIRAAARNPVKSLRSE